MTVKCYIQNSGKTKWKKIGTVEISCSEKMAEFLDGRTNNDCWIKSELIRVGDDDIGYSHMVDDSIAKKVKEIAEETKDIGDILIANEFRAIDNFFFERKDHDFSYVKTVEKVEDRLVYMRANSGKLFAIRMNDWLYFNDSPKPKDKVEVTKFLTGKSVVTSIVERYVKKEYSKEEIEEILGNFDRLVEDY